MTCQEFLARYTDFRDGLITAPREVRRFARHLASCAVCRRYDAALRHGVGALQGTTHHAANDDFRRRLERRLANERARAGRPHIPARPALAGALLVAVALSFVAWEGARRHPAEARAPSIPPVPFPKPVAQAGLPFVSFQDPRTGIASGNPYPYGTAFVEPASARR
jgi:anti-sigma factor RsiW